MQANNTPLGEIIKQLARYRHGYLACDPNVADLRVMGAFPLADTDKSLAMLAQIFPVRIHRRFLVGDGGKALTPILIFPVPFLPFSFDSLENLLIFQSG